MKNFQPQFWATLVAAVLTFSPRLPAAVVINEVHYNPDIKVEPVEFVELYNAGTNEVDLSSWAFTSGISYTFPAGTRLPADRYLVVAQKPSALSTKYGAASLGPYTGSLSKYGEKITLRNAQGQVENEVEYQDSFPWPIIGDAPGNSIELIHPSLDNSLGGSWRPSQGRPSPLARNSVFATNSPPQIRQVTHTPEQPGSDQPVVITTKITDPDGVSKVELLYQIVEPGSYVEITDPTYATRWSRLVMNDAGTNGDAVAGDDTYSATVPAVAQKHRRLVRYRIEATDRGNRKVLVPYAEDAQPNFAYFVYDGVPAWSGAVRPGVTPAVQFGTNVMRHLPSLHLLAKSNSVAQATWFAHYRADAAYPWSGTLVYDGKVYDNIHYRMRGGVWRYSMVKNMWKFDLNRGHYMSVRDDYGKKFKAPWAKLNLGSVIQQGDFNHRGEQGLFESVGFRLFNLVGVESPNTTFSQFRIIDDAAEAGSDQYEGDFWGLYLLLENEDTQMLEQHDLPDGNLYKMDQSFGSPPGSLNNQGATEVTNRSDLKAFVDNYTLNNGSLSDAWWRTNMNLPKYFSYHTIVQGIHHFDIADGKNYFYFHNPTNGLWETHTWDLDLTWANIMYHAGVDGGDEPFKSRVLTRPAFFIEYANRVREIRDLLFNSDQGYALIDEMAFLLRGTNEGPNFLDADRSMWDWNPKMLASAGYSENGGKAGQGRFYQWLNEPGVSRDFNGGIQLMKNYIDYRGGLLDARIRGAGGITLLNAKSIWSWQKGTEEPDPAWRQTPFNDSAWSTGPAPVGYDSSGTPVMGTALADMRNNYTSIYLRKTFVVTNASQFKGLRMEALFDDGFVAWINGTLVASTNARSANPPFNDTSSANAAESNTYESFTLPTPAGYLVEGTNVLTVMALNLPLTTSSDCFFDARLVGITQVADPNTDLTLPTTPTLAYTGPANFPLNRLSFRASSFNGGSGPFGAIKWRVGEVSPTNAPGFDPTQERSYEITPVWESPEFTTFSSDLTLPVAPLKLGRHYRVRVKMMDATGRWSHWSAPVEFAATQPDNATALHNDLKVTELMYNPVAGNDFEFIELQNQGQLPMDLGGLKFTTGIDYTFPSPTLLAPGAFLLVTKTTNAAAFRSHYLVPAEVPLFGPYTGSFNDNGEPVALRIGGVTDLVSFTYGDGRGWPVAADGAGHSLVPLERSLAGQATGSLNYGGNWRASSFIKGSPGRTDPAAPTGIVLNEIVSHTDFSVEFDSNDWIELHNPGAGAVTLGAGWYLSDDASNLKKFAIPANSLLPARGWVSFDEVTGFHTTTNGFGISKGGEQVFLSHLPGTSQDRVVDALSFKGQENETSFGRYPDGAEDWFVLPRTRGLANGRPLPHLLLNEVMYHPKPTAVNPEDNSLDEYIELSNPTAQTIAFTNAWGAFRLGGGVSFTFPSNLTLAPGSFILVVNFNPTNIPLLAQFKSVFSLTTNPVLILGPYQGKLNNGTDRVSLESPLNPDLPGDPVGWVVVDEVIYGDQSPWPVGPDGTGLALHRVNPDKAGNNPFSWLGAEPSPGSLTTTDRDGDGLPDAWEIEHGLNPDSAADAGLDPDGDGQTNLEEYRAGTDPNNSQSTLRIRSVTVLQESVLLQFEALGGRSYSVEYANGLESGWQVLSPVPAQGSSRLVTVTNTPALSPRFYRLKTTTQP